jgi:hypothetical protein
MFVQGGVKKKVAIAGGALIIALACANSTQAVISVNLGGGWIASWDSSFAGLVSVVATGPVVGNALHIEKSAEWTAAQAPVNGIVPSIIRRSQWHRRCRDQHRDG